jgi:ATP-binding cassette subfamily C (CFTR/MRP) protein 4
MTRTFAFWLDMCCFIYIAIVIVSFFFTDSSSGNVGLAITQALGLTNIVQLGMRQSAVLENVMTAVERVVEYQSVDPEPAFESEGEKKPPKDWPEKGHIKFKNVSLSYSPDMHEKVLRELEFEIHSQEKIGIVGRTGAGKSSIINALFRLSYLDGTIEIDLRDTQDMGLHDLRSKIAIIPQVPVLFSGTMRYNLDPFDEYPDDKLWSALEEVNLKDVIKNMPAGLNSKISEGGTNFSVGQRQLICLARAIVRENKILVMDEATANVDLETDELIQKTIREKFADCSVLTIAHRLNTIMDNERILVMDAGRCVEFDTPLELLNNTEGIFYGMLKETEKATFESLKKIAEEVRRHLEVTFKINL